MKTVNASGAMNLRSPWMIDFDWSSTISTTVYQLWRTGDDLHAFYWVLVNLAISAAVLLTVNLLERKQRKGVRGV